MTSAVADAIFLDTNILVYANVAGSPLHEEALAAIRHNVAVGAEQWISRQILPEYLAVVTRPRFARPVSTAVAAADVNYFQSRFRVAEDGPEVTARLLALLQQIAMGGKQIHDANIVATMLCHGVKTLVTDNVADFRRFGELIRIVPLEP